MINRLKNATIASLFDFLSLDDEERLKRKALIQITLFTCIAGLGYGAIYVIAFGIWGAARIVFIYIFLSLLNLLYFYFYKHYLRFRTIQLFLILFLPPGAQLGLGGFVSASGVGFSTLLAPLGALLFHRSTVARLFFYGFVIIMMAIGVIEYMFMLDHQHNVTAEVRLIFFVLMTTFAGGVIYFLLESFIIDKEKIQKVVEEKNELLHQQQQEIIAQNEELLQQQEEITAQSQQLKRVLEKMEAQNHILQESETELLQLNAVKTKYFSLLSHDMRNSFGSLRMYLPLLEDRLKPHMDPQTGQLFANFKASVKNINNLLDNLLIWSLSQMNMMPMEQKPVALAVVAEENFELFRPVADEKKIALLNHVQPGVFVSADANMLNTILRNLISNALKFTPEGGTITVSSWQNGNKTEIEVRDSGTGISEVDQMKLFNVSTNHKTAQAAKGTGLGLILCKEFTEKMGGRIRVESEPGRGTAFVFWLPESRQ